MSGALGALREPVLRGASGALATRLAAERLHLQHGPIDLVIDATGESDLAFAAAWRRFDGLLQELVAELGALRTPLPHATPLDGVVARRMVAACTPLADRFITPMAAVAGAVADEVLAAMVAAASLERAAVNNGGDIALHLANGAQFRFGVIADPTLATRHGHRPALDGAFIVREVDPMRGIATSGWRGRSHSRGIADSVTVLARDAAHADAAATMIANAVDVDAPGIVRARACEVADESDLGAIAVTRAVPPLDPVDVERARDAGAAYARRLAERCLIDGALLLLQGRSRVIGTARLHVDAAADPT